jgi:peroxisomal 3,2-trans-enoyl-CoA isomerase
VSAQAEHGSKASPTSFLLPKTLTYKFLFPHLVSSLKNGSAVAFAQHMGVHRSNEFFMFGKKLTAEELETYGLVNKIFPKEGFHDAVIGYLQEQLKVNDGKSMIETKRLQNAPLRDQRILAAYNAFDALSERFVEDAPAKRFAAKKAELEAKSKARAKI